MIKRKRFFDDRILYDPKTDRIIIARVDVKIGNDPWEFWCFDGIKSFFTKGPPKKFIEIDRVPERSLE